MEEVLKFNRERIEEEIQYLQKQLTLQSRFEGGDDTVLPLFEDMGELHFLTVGDMATTKYGDIVRIEEIQYPLEGMSNPLNARVLTEAGEVFRADRLV